MTRRPPRFPWPATPKRSFRIPRLPGMTTPRSGRSIRSKYQVVVQSGIFVPREQLADDLCEDRRLDEPHEQTIRRWRTRCVRRARGVSGFGSWEIGLRRHGLVAGVSGGPPLLIHSSLLPREAVPASEPSLRLVPCPCPAVSRLSPGPPPEGRGARRGGDRWRGLRPGRTVGSTIPGLTGKGAGPRGTPESHGFLCHDILK